MEETDKYAAQKKYLANKKNLRVWVDADKFAALKEKAQADGTSIYALVNGWIDQYLEKPSE